MIVMPTGARASRPQETMPRDFGCSELQLPASRFPAQINFQFADHPAVGEGDQSHLSIGLAGRKRGELELANRGCRGSGRRRRPSPVGFALVPGLHYDDTDFLVFTSRSRNLESR